MLDYGMRAYMAYVNIVMRNSNIEDIGVIVSDTVAEDFVTYVVESYFDVNTAIEMAGECTSNLILITLQKSLSDWLQDTDTGMSKKEEFPEFMLAVSKYIGEISKLYSLDNMMNS